MIQFFLAFIYATTLRSISCRTESLSKKMLRVNKLNLTKFMSIYTLKVKTLNGHESYVKSLVLLEDKTLASASVDKTIKIWNITNGSLIKTLNGHLDAVNSLVILQDNLLASASNDETIKIWNINSGEMITTLTGHSSSVRSLILLPNGTLISGALDNSIRLWNTTTGETTNKLTSKILGFYSLALLGYDTLASAVWDGSILIWNLSNGKIVKILKGEDHANYFLAMTALSDGSLASSFFGKSIKIWNITTGEMINQIWDKFAYSLAELPNGLVASGNVGYLNIYDIKNSTEIKVLKQKDIVHCIALLPDGTVASGSDFNVRIWNLTLDQDKINGDNNNNLRYQVFIGFIILHIYLAFFAIYNYALF